MCIPPSTFSSVAFPALGTRHALYEQARTSGHGLACAPLATVWAAPPTAFGTILFLVPRAEGLRLAMVALPVECWALLHSLKIASKVHS